MTTIYLDGSEYEALAVLPGRTSCKRRYDEALAAVRPLPGTVRELTGEVGIDGGDLAG